MKWKKGGDFSALDEDAGVVRSISFRSTNDEFIDAPLPSPESKVQNGILLPKPRAQDIEEDVPQNVQMPERWNKRKKSRVPLPPPARLDQLHTMTSNQEVYLAPPDAAHLSRGLASSEEPFGTTYSAASTLQLVETTAPSTPTELSSTFDRSPWLRALFPSSGPNKREARMLWPRLLIFCLAAGMANIARLPSVSYTQGSGVFVVAYVILALFLGLPLLFLELSLGQFSRSCASKMWAVVPLFKGVGVVQTVASFFLLVSYPVYMAMAFRYTVDAIRGPYPLSKCQNTTYDSCNTSISTASVNYTNSELCFVCVIAENSGTNQSLSWRLIISQILSWLLVFLAMVKGLRSLAIAAFVVFVVVLVFQLALFGHFAQIDPNFSQMKEHDMWQWDLLFHSKTWSSALLQLILSYQLGFGTNVTLAGRCSFRNNIFRTTLIIFFVNLAMGLLSFIVGYQILKWASITPHFRFNELLMFVVIYDSSVKLLQSGSSGAVAWAAVAFLSIFISGFISMCVIVWCLMRTIVEEMEFKKDQKKKKILLQGLVLVLAVIFGFSCFWNEGLHVLYALDRVIIAASIASLILLLIGILWIYGFKNIKKDIEFMTGRKLLGIMKWIWALWCPAVLLGLSIWRLVHLFFHWKDVRENRPQWVLWLFLVLFLMALALVVVIAARKIFLQIDYDCLSRLKHTVRPSKSWGPSDPFEHHHWLRWKDLNSMARTGVSSASSGGPRRIFVTQLSSMSLSKMEGNNINSRPANFLPDEEDYTET